MGDDIRPLQGVISPRVSFAETIAVFLSCFGFWFLFAHFFMTFYRDDNVASSAPLISIIVDNLLHGRPIGHTQLLGGGGGLSFSPAMYGTYDPFYLIPALLLKDRPELMMNVINAIHIAILASGAWFMGLKLGACRWAALVGAISLCFSGFYFIWMGNWTTNLVPYAFIPWLFGFVASVLHADTRGKLVRAQFFAACAMVEVFLSGFQFAGFFLGFIAAPLLAYCVLTLPNTTDLLKHFKRVAILIPVFLVIIAPVLWDQKQLYSFYGGRLLDWRDWFVLSVPLQGYAGLLFPNLYSLWVVPWASSPLLSSGILSSGFVPAWFLIFVLVREPLTFTAPRILVLIAGLAVLLPILSPAAFGLSKIFSETPVLNFFRWPFRGLPVFHILLVIVFLILVRESAIRPSRCWKIIIVSVCLCGGLLTVFHEWHLFTSRSPVLSWFRATPLLNDPETWQDSTLRLLQRSGYVANLCSSEIPFHQKPRLFFYGNLGVDYKIPTVHMYMVPLCKAYIPLGMSVKGCIQSWTGLKFLIENGPRKPLEEDFSWDDPRGPADFQELVAKTYVSAVIVDIKLKEPMGYFNASDSWKLVEKRSHAALFVRKALQEAEAESPEKDNALRISRNSQISPMPPRTVVPQVVFRDHRRAP
jgi:hypothetical protein